MDTLSISFTALSISGDAGSIVSIFQYFPLLILRFFFGGFVCGCSPPSSSSLSEAEEEDEEEGRGLLTPLGATSAPSTTPSTVVSRIISSWVLFSTRDMLLVLGLVGSVGILNDRRVDF
ncbi:ORF1026 [White spot syndrome virus]|uniref:ORF1026 n=1 Tax=White spot syndrome virus TaxID=342409 RepID=A0A2D3I5A8_9VIRU|nr:ORF1026 [White spot syndrome virus]